MEQAAHKTSAARMRLGVLLLLLWWLPFWLAAPYVAGLFGIQSDSGKHGVLIAIIAVQTLLGAFGTFLTGKEIVKLVKKQPKKRLPKTIWHILRSGDYDEPSTPGLDG